MKKTTKSLLTTALILAVAGLLLSLGSFIYAKIVGVDIYGADRKKHSAGSAEYKLAQILENSPESDYTRKLTTTPFTRVDVLSFVGKVEILPTDGETYVTLTDAGLDNIQVEVVGTTLTVAEREEVGFMGVYVGEKGFSFKGLRQIFGPGNSADTAKVMTVYLNRETVPEEISVRSSIGDIEMLGVGADLITVHSFMGKMEVQGVHATKIQVEKTLGTLHFSENEYTSLNASVRFGTIEGELPEGSGQSTVLDVWIGSCSVKTDAPLNRYKLTFSATLGGTKRNGVSKGKSLQAGTLTTNRITASVLIGTVSANDGGQPEDAPLPENPAEEVPTETAEPEAPADTLPD